MQKPSSVPCILSLIFGASGFPLYVILLFIRKVFLDMTLGPFTDVTSEAEAAFLPIGIIGYVIIAALAVAGIAAGIIGIKQKRPLKGFAIAGIIVSAIIIILPVFFFGFIHIVFPD